MNRPAAMLTVLVLCGSALLTAPGCDKSSEDSEADNGLLKVEATYVGSRKCRSCHETQYAGWTYSGHARVIQSAKGRPWIVHGDFTQPVYANNEMEKIDFKLEDVRYIHGVNWKQRYIDKDWRIRKVMWNYDDKKWHPYHQSDWKDRDWRKLCARCHTVGYDPDNHSFKEMGIGCESCHGPGSRHVKAPDVLKNTHIRNPAKMSHDAAAAVCGACHVRGKKRPGYAAAFPVGLEPGMTLNPSHYPQIPPTDKHWWPNGAAKGHHQQFIEWEQSGHRRAGLSCRHCHTPHKSSRRTSTRAARNRLCINCHTGVSTDPIRGHAPLAGAPQHFNCIGCHYPKIAKSATSGDITSHRGYIPPSETIKYAKEGKIQPNSCNACHAHADQTKPKNKPEYLQKSIDDARKKLTPIATMR